MPVQKQFNTIFVGNGLNSHGFVGASTISGLGLITRGFLWDARDIWNLAAIEDPSPTTWTNGAVETVRGTVWTDAAIEPPDGNL